jgi:hypothetical protein
MCDLLIGAKASYRDIVKVDVVRYCSSREYSVDLAGSAELSDNRRGGGRS